jgi:hypothetical protein
MNILAHPDYRSSYLEVYVAIYSRVGTSPHEDNFYTCFPSIQVIAERFGHSPQTVMEGTAWLESVAYLFKERRRRTSNLYTIILKRDWFLQMRRTDGDKHAQARYKVWLAAQQAALKEVTPNRRRPHNASAPPAQGQESGGASTDREVTAANTSRPSPKNSYPLVPDLDPPNIRTTENRSDDLEPELPLGSFSRREFFD